MYTEDPFDRVMIPMEEVKLVLTAGSQIYDAFYFFGSLGL